MKNVLFIFFLSLICNIALAQGYRVIKNDKGEAVLIQAKEQQIELSSEQLISSEGGSMIFVIRDTLEAVVKLEELDKQLEELERQLQQVLSARQRINAIKKEVQKLE